MQRYAKNIGTLKGSVKVFKQKSASLIGDCDHIKASDVTAEVTSFLLSASYDSVYTNLYKGRDPPPWSVIFLLNHHHLCARTELSGDQVLAGAGVV